MTHRRAVSLSFLVMVVLLGTPQAARAIPAFARKYETSCLTCHTVYPRLTPFGEAFRRNGYRFPGVDSDYVKQPQVVLGQEANKKTFPNSVWPSSIPLTSIVSIGANGEMTAYPSADATVPRANPGLRFSMDNLVAEGHLWAGAAVDDTTTLWAEMTLSSDGTVSVEHAQLLLNDLLGPAHAVNLVVGRGFPTLTSFGPHSSYIGDQRITNLPVTGIYGLSGDSFVLVDNYNGLELNGVIAGNLGWSVGVAAGKNNTSLAASSQDYYGHLGYKIGGMRLDGEGSKGPADAMKPWTEDALTVDVFAHHAVDWGQGPGYPGAPTDRTTSVQTAVATYGAAARGQLGSAELDLGGYVQDYTLAMEGQPNLPSVKADVEWAELSYVVFPWMVPAVRLERIALKPDGVASASDVHLMPGIAFLLRANIKAVLVANFEMASGFPQDPAGNALAWQGGNADWGGLIMAPKDAAQPTAKRNEFQSIALFVAWAI